MNPNRKLAWKELLWELAFALIIWSIFFTLYTWTSWQLTKGGALDWNRLYPLIPFFFIVGCMSSFMFPLFSLYKKLRFAKILMEEMSFTEEQAYRAVFTFYLRREANELKKNGRWDKHSLKEWLAEKESLSPK